MIPGTLVRESLGYCDGTNEWFERWVDLITRAPKFDDEDPWAYTYRNGIRPMRERGYWPTWWDTHVEGMPSIWSRVERRNWARTTQPLSNGCTVLVCYPYRSDSAEEPSPSDSCAFVDLGALPDDFWCNGSCKGRP